MNDNRVFINKHNIVEIKVCGDQTVASVQAMGDEAMHLAASLRKKKQPALILDNLLEMGSVPVEARRRVAELVKSSEYDRLAMLGSGTLLKLGANLILQAAGRGKYVRYFDSRTSAINWLKNK
jgi:UDP-N-acetylmuramyl pentapeptide synthase